MTKITEEQAIKVLETIINMETILAILAKH